MFEIRQVEQKDTEAIKVFKDVVSNESKFMSIIPLEQIDKLIKKYSTEPNKYYVAVAGDKILGQILIEIQKGFVAYICHFALLKEMYGTGLADKLLQLVIDNSKAAGVKNIELLVHDDNIRARHFYTKYGFVFNRRQNSEPTKEVFRLKLNVDFERKYKKLFLIDKW